MKKNPFVDGVKVGQMLFPDNVKGKLDEKKVWVEEQLSKFAQKKYEVGVDDINLTPSDSSDSVTGTQLEFTKGTKKIMLFVIEPKNGRDKGITILEIVEYTGKGGVLDEVGFKQGSFGNSPFASLGGFASKG